MMASSERNLEEDRDEAWEQPQSQVVDVKSTAMVKLARRLPVYQFSRLDQNTDLHLPPDNWLRSEAQLSKTWVTGECTQFSSFAMAETLPDTVGEVDVISAAENIKKLLKIPFNKMQVSMAVHRVGKTLLLDELDLLKHLRSASQGEREWMKTFLLQAVLSEGKNLTMTRKTNELLQSWNLLSKFLCYSIGNSPDESVPQQSYDFEEQHLPQSQSALVQIPDLLPKTKPSEFARQVLWQFEDIRMLIGTDLPIFGEGTHPAVSLRLKDMSSPINVLTGLDYWLDNLMSNVPELAMCYHLNGIVQKYELLKTEEIPNLEEAKFAPQVVKDIAQNILSFLKSHCTKEGHTYWLFKGQDEDVVKLYDLTSLCNEYPNRPWENPFISPVAMLLYRVARNLSMSGPNKKDKSTMYKLLKNCLQLLEGNEGQHPEVAASASHLLSHIFINEDDLNDPQPPAASAPASQKASNKAQRQPADSSSASDEDELVIEEEDERGSSLSVPSMNTQSLKQPSSKHSSSSGMGGFKECGRHRRRSAKTVYASREEKARMALAFIVKGLKSIMKCPQSTDTRGGQKQAAKLPSPLPSPTRVRPLCYSRPSVTRDTGGKAELADTELRQLPGGTVSALDDFGGVDSGAETEQLSKEQEDLFLPEKMMSDTNRDTLGGVVVEAHSTEARNSSEARSTTKLLEQEVTTSSTHVVPVFTSPGMTDKSGQVVEIEGNAKPEEPVISSRSKGSILPGQLPGAVLQEQPNGKDGSSGSSDRSAHFLEDSKPLGAEEPLRLTDLSIAGGKWHPGSWQHELSFLLLKKAGETYLVLAKANRDAERYGLALHFAHMSLFCQSACQSMDDRSSVNLPDPSSALNLLSDQLAVCGDCLTLLTHNLVSYVRQREDFRYSTAEDRLILSEAQQHHLTNDHEWAVDFRNDTEHNLKTSIQCYTLALSEGTGRGDDYLTALRRKQGNAHNELGVCYMNQALAMRNEEGTFQEEQDLWYKSLRCFESGIKIFESVKDTANISLLLCNVGKLMRLCAFSCGESELYKRSEMRQQERYYYNKAVDYYQRALTRLGQRKKNPSLWESVTWELSSTYFAMATILQDHPPLSSMAQEQIEKEILELMNKALQLCEVDDITPAKQPVYQYRTATIHHRLASLHHNAYRNQSSQQKQKHTRSLAELHYQKAIRLFSDLDRPSELLRVLLERVALLEHQFEGQSGVSARIKTLQSALEALLQCRDALNALQKAWGKEARELGMPTSTVQDAGRVDSDVVERGRMSPKAQVDVGEWSRSSDDETADPKGTLSETDVPNSGTRNLGVDPLERQRRTSEEEAVEDPGMHQPAPGSSETGASSAGGQGSQPEGQGSKVKDRLSKEEEEERQRLESIWESRLQYMLRNLVKLHSTNKKGMQQATAYKKMYAASLGRTLPASLSSVPPSPASSTESPVTLLSILDEVQQLFQAIN
ncbi:erythroid differentiation-related factor 1-like [Acanthaster planci]|uniref:Erythroid differentiation-related factor 1-like n=1 Tax=Acanthaster planci TaxID=133434 RepID=A0A8B7XJ24_ACAPL|nr:erythroid differentiation-related factor 1-like [Acanthaster planci]